MGGNLIIRLQNAFEGSEKGLDGNMANEDSIEFEVA